MAIHWPILRRLLANPLKTVITDDSRDYRGVDLLVASLHMADRIEATCRTKNVGPLLPTSGAFPIAALGAWMAGRTIVPLNYLLKPDELQYVVDTWPTEIMVSAQIDAEVLDFTYPELRYQAAGANIAVANGSYSDVQNQEFGQRWYTGRSGEGEQTIRFAPLSFALRDTRIDFLYERAYQATALLYLYNYTQMNDDYNWYLRQVYSDLSVGEEWLNTLEYEMVRLAF